MSGTTSGDDSETGSEAARAARIGSARADFISSLGRRVLELRASLNDLEQDLGSPRHRDDLRRRVHALSAGARLLRFGAMATSLAEAERTLERAAAAGGLEQAEIRAIAEILDSLPSLAWNEPAQAFRPTEQPPLSTPIGEAAVVPPTVLVIGNAGLADALAQAEIVPDGDEIECERTGATGAALELAWALAPDVVVLDTDLAGARELIEKLARDPLTEPTPLVAVGSWPTPEEGARWIAAGASRALAKPVSPHQLRQACIELSRSPQKASHRAPLGQTTVEDLTQVIIEEVKRGLPQALVQGQSTPIQLGDGSDVLAAVWGAVARVRDLLTIKSGGAVRFSNEGPEGALPMAPWWSEGPAAAQRGAETKQEPEPRLDGRKILVADDDPAVTWFIGGVLRAVGAEVREAHDGNRAVELSFRLSPDVVISDVLMPGLDGFALCRALKHDIALRDIPVILLSWKEDLLQRLRDLGADADGYLRKEASAAAILKQVSEVLRPRARIEARLRGEGEVRGRLDGVTPRTLLYATSRLRPNARLSIRDASFLYELEMRGGAPMSATRTTSDGSFQRGKEVFAAMLGVRAGRFVVARATHSIRGTLEGTLESQLETPIAHARAALRLLGGTRLLEVHRVSVAVDRVLAYLAATPEPARSLVTRLANGASPRGLILGSEVAPAELEEVLCDLATHGAIVGVQGAGGVDLLGPALNQELNSIRRAGIVSNHPAPSVKLVVVERGENSTAKSAAKMEPPKPDRAKTPVRAEPGKPLPGSSQALPQALPVPPGPAVAARPAYVPRPESGPTGAVLGKIRVGPGVGLAEMRKVGESASGRLDLSSEIEGPSTDRFGSAPEILVAPVAWPDDADELTPSSLEAALIREISERTALPEKAPASAGPRPSIVDTSGLRARFGGAAPTLSEPPAPRPALPSLPPDAIVPENSSEDRVKVAELAATDHAIESPPRSERVRADLRREGETPRPTSFVLGVFVALGAMALLFFGLRFAREQIGPAATSITPAPGAPTEPLPPASAAPDENAHPSPADLQAGLPGAMASATPTSGEDIPLPVGAVVPPGQGLLDIETGGREAIFVDGIELGRGPFLRLSLALGVHEVRIRAHGEERIRFVMIRAARRTRLPLSSAWTR